jgi:hypothetical protein
MPQTSTTITFTGLLVFRRDTNTGKYAVGILRARDAHEPHYFQIEFGPDGEKPKPIPQEELEQIIKDGNVSWALEVVGAANPTIKAKHHKPGDRKKPTKDDEKDLGWIINMENDEFHKGQLKRTPKALQPVIQLTEGTLFTSCKTDSVVTLQGVSAQVFGFIAGGIGLEIDTSQGQQPVLSYTDKDGKKVEVLRLKETEKKSYKVSIFNTPKLGTSIKENHFHLYYDKLFTQVDHHKRYDLRLLKPPVEPPGDRCDEATGEATEDPPVATPNPFRCGGILVEGGDPLG